MDAGEPQSEHFFTSFQKNSKGFALANSIQIIFEKTWRFIPSIL